MTTETGVLAACANSSSFASHAFTGFWLAFARVGLMTSPRTPPRERVGSGDETMQGKRREAPTVPKCVSKL